MKLAEIDNLKIIINIRHKLQQEISSTKQILLTMYHTLKASNTRIQGILHFQRQLNHLRIPSTHSHTHTQHYIFTQSTEIWPAQAFRIRSVHRQMHTHKSPPQWGLSHIQPIPAAPLHHPSCGEPNEISSRQTERELSVAVCTTAVHVCALKYNHLQEGPIYSELAVCAEMQPARELCK